MEVEVQFIFNVFVLLHPINTAMLLSIKQTDIISDQQEPYINTRNIDMYDLIERATYSSDGILEIIEEFQKTLGFW